MTDDRHSPPAQMIRPRRLPYFAAGAILLGPVLALLVLRRDIVIEIGALPWMIASGLVTAALAWALLRLSQPRPLMRISPSGIALPGVLSDELSWRDIRLVEAATRRKSIGDVQDRLIIHLMRPAVLDWQTRRLQRLYGGVPQAAIAVDITFAWPERAEVVCAMIRDAAKSFAAAPALQSMARQAKSQKPGRRSKLLMVGVLIAAASMPALMQTLNLSAPRLFSDALNLYQAGDVVAALPLLQSDARAGDVQAALALGALYLNGDGVERNPSMAAGWFQRAADAGDAMGAYRLGDSYRLGLGMQQDIAQARQWYERAADAGAPEAAFALARMYRLGDGVRRDYTQAIHWLNRAAAAGFAPAEHDLGQLYHDGIAVPRDPQTAANWYLKAAERGHVPARYDLARLLLDGGPDSRKRGLELLRTAAEAGYAPAQRRWALSINHGLGVPRDPIEAYKWMSLAERSWPAATRADLVREKARIAAHLDAATLDEAKARIRAWSPKGR